MDTLVLSQVNLTDDNIRAFLMMLQKTKSLKKLNISNNYGLSTSAIGQILAQLKTKGTNAAGTGGI